MYSTADLQLFIRIADTGSLSRAARELNQQPATASASLKRLEKQLDARLFERSTRSMRLTPQGEIFLEYSRKALALLADGAAQLGADRGAMRGHIRLSAPSDLGRYVLLPWLDAFQQQHPQVTLGLQISDHISDLFREPVDIAVRYGRLDDSTLTAQPIAHSRRVVVASPAYLARCGIPRTPQDLAGHSCLLYYLRRRLHNTWRFRSAKGEFEIRVRGDRMADDGAVVRQWAVAGHGLADKSWLDVQDDVEAGRLVTVLDEYTGQDYPLNAVYPHRDSPSTASRALVAYLRERFDERARRG